MKDLEVSKYLSRVGLSDCHDSLEDLTKLQELHMLAIPFENLDIIVRRKIGLEKHHLFEKIITKNRGGYCFELNTLYADLLSSLGFVLKPVLGRVWISNPKSLPPRNHFANLVILNGITYITDVGFGGLITRVPLDINDSSIVIDKDGKVRVVQLSDFEYMIQRYGEHGWMNQYSFENIKVSREDIEISNYYMSKHPNSHFYRHRFIGKNTADGRIGLFNNKMTIRKGIKIIRTKRIEFGSEWIELIRSEFSVDLDFSNQEIDLLFDNKIN